MPERLNEAGRFYELNNTAEQIDNILTDINDIIENEVYDIPIVLKKGQNENRDYLALDTSLRDGAFIRAARNQSTNLIEYTIGDKNNLNQQVSFTVDDIKRLLALPNILPMSQADYEQIENPDNNTLYTTWDDER